MNPYSKMIGAFFGAGIGTLGTAMLDGNLTQNEATIALGGALVAAAATFGFPANHPAPPTK